MKRTENNEMDLLLRSLGRKAAQPLFADRATEGQPFDAHLDADELSSYAEHVLPAATRARYTSHLADCSRCRKLVAELTSVAGLKVREHVSEETAASFSQTMRHLFSFAVLRYAVPALALIAVAAVGLIVFRQQRPTELVARNEPATAEVGPSANQQTETSTASNSASGVSGKDRYVTDSAAGPASDQKPKTGEQREAKTSSSNETAAVDREKDLHAEKAVGAVAQPTFAPEPAPAPAWKAADSVADARKEPATRTESPARPQSAQPKEETADRDTAVRTGERAQQEQRARGKAEDRENQVANTQTTAATPQPRRGLAKLRTAEGGRGAATGNKRADDAAAETRSVAGRRFRRQGGVWIDTAYHSGVSVITIVRGSEQYRALVSDEPAIRTIADELAGEVVLIWKGRGYRIR